VESPGYLTAKQGDFHALYDYRGRAAYYIKLGDRTVYDLTGKPAFKIENDWLLRHDGGADLYFGVSVIDGEPNPGSDEEMEFERLRAEIFPELAPLSKTRPSYERRSKTQRNESRWKQSCKRRLRQSSD
jgi:hypothetical protein